ncbi:MAG: SufE family protein [Parachlamydiaceae bacterium]|nr:SufE family protein [Parachlamydiaceae bacterium]
MFESCLEKQNIVKQIFNACPTEEAKYQKIIDWGRELPKLKPIDKVPTNIVKGCQSTMYLHSFWTNDTIIFEVESDALISAGLAAILIKVYSGETPETILKCPPTFLEELGISASLTPNRANGLYSIHLRMKQDALKLLMEKEMKKKSS